MREIADDCQVLDAHHITPGDPASRKVNRIAVSGWLCAAKPPNSRSDNTVLIVDIWRGPDGFYVLGSNLHIGQSVYCPTGTAI